MHANACYLPTERNATETVERYLLRFRNQHLLPNIRAACYVLAQKWRSCISHKYARLFFRGKSCSLCTSSSTDLPQQVPLFSTAAKQFSTPSQTPYYTMCIQWCCKHCPNNSKLTHIWARDRCNDFFISRSHNENITECPRGPFELRRAYHRHPYRKCIFSSTSPLPPPSSSWVFALKKPC